MSRAAIAGECSLPARRHRRRTAVEPGYRWPVQGKGTKPHGSDRWTVDHEGVLLPLTRLARHRGCRDVLTSIAVDQLLDKVFGQLEVEYCRQPSNRGGETWTGPATSRRRRSSRGSSSRRSRRRCASSSATNARRRSASMLSSLLSTIVSQQRTVRSFGIAMTRGRAASTPPRGRPPPQSEQVASIASFANGP